jgi:hypothetical protein|tara:strand:- start:71 stop:346 length:276 start_codon:yes stop_codon:yes gene_type:complete
MVTLPDPMSSAATIQEHNGPVAETAIGYGKLSFTNIYLFTKIIPPDTTAHERRKKDDFTQYNFDSDSMCNSWKDFTRSMIGFPVDVNDGTD